MAVKMSGAEFKRFYGDAAWWQGQRGTAHTPWHEEATIMIDGEQIDENYDLDLTPDAAVVSLDGGIVQCEAWDDNKSYTLDGYFRAWKKKQSTITIVVTCDRATEDTVRAAIKAAGGKIS